MLSPLGEELPDDPCAFACQDASGNRDLMV
jgi:hypothetical protein